MVFLCFSRVKILHIAPLSNLILNPKLSVWSQNFEPHLFIECFTQTSEPVMFTFIYLFMVEHYYCFYGHVPPCFSEKQMLNIFEI